LAESPTRVHGGDLVLAYDGDETTVRFRHNRLVVFPSKTLHKVTRVRVDSNDPRHARISLQSWLAYGPAPAKPKRRAPEADRPTFLLAEASIIDAARRMIDSSAQTPEDVYWGAFYASRILTANLRCVVDALGEELGPIRIRRGEELEVYGRLRGDPPMRIGFALGGRGAPAAEALRLFVEVGRGAAKSDLGRVVPAGAGERQTIAILQRLLKSAYGRPTTGAGVAT
jgi:hypothetical protein